MPLLSASIPKKTNPFAPRRYGEVQKITDAVYIFRNITNSSFVIGERAVAVIDTQVNPSSAGALLKAVRSVTTKPIRYVINTHYHWDHSNGNQIFKNEGAEIISSVLTREFMVKRHDRQKEFLSSRGFELSNDPLLPEITFQGEHFLDLGNRPLRLFFAGRAETDDATAVYVEKENILMSGDTVMTGSFPIFGQPVWDEGLQGDNQWIETIGKLMSLKPAHVVPGHGPLAHGSEVDLLVRIEEYFLKEVGTLVRKGAGLERVLAELEPRLPDWITTIPIVWGTPRYAILRVFRGLTKKEGDAEPGWQRFKPSAIPRGAGERVARAVRGKESFNEFLKMASEAKEGGDGALVLAILKKTTELFPNLPDAWTAYAEALVDESRSVPSVLEKGDFFEPAKKCWDRALGLEANHVGALLGKGRYWTMMAYRGGDDPGPGMKLLEKVVELKPGGRAEAEAEFYIGVGYRRLHDEEKARRQFQKAIQLDSTFMPAHLASQS